VVTIPDAGVGFGDHPAAAVTIPDTGVAFGDRPAAVVTIPDTGVGFGDHRASGEADRLVRVTRPSRRVVLGWMAAAPWVVAACTGDDDDTATGGTTSSVDEPDRTGATTLPPTPACGDASETPPQTEGPFYTPDTPERSSLRGDGPGTPLAVEGVVLTTACDPVAGALLDWWHADDDGEYDNEGYRFRGHHFADDEGRFRLETIVPGLYPGRTRHLHVKVQRAGGEVLTTQLYFPGEERNERDSIFDPALVMTMGTAGNGGEQQGSFTFVLR
jgi:protocatechuate 3,4-dioxygenase beta subunit